MPMDMGQSSYVAEKRSHGIPCKREKVSVRSKRVRVADSVGSCGALRDRRIHNGSPLRASGQL